MDSKNAAVMFVLGTPVNPYFINGHEKLETDATQETALFLNQFLKLSLNPQKIGKIEIV